MIVACGSLHWSSSNVKSLVFTEVKIQNVVCKFSAKDIVQLYQQLTHMLTIISTADRFVDTYIDC